MCRRGGVQGNPIERVPLAPLFHRARRILSPGKRGAADAAEFRTARAKPYGRGGWGKPGAVLPVERVALPFIVGA